jgi:hypothetical protein
MPFTRRLYCLQDKHFSSKVKRVKQSHYRPEQAQMVDRGIAISFLDPGARRGGWSAPRPGRFTPGKDPVPIIQEAGRAPGPVWTCEKNLAPTGIRSPDRPAHSQLLYRLSYPALKHFSKTTKIRKLTFLNKTFPHLILFLWIKYL